MGLGPAYWFAVVMLKPFLKAAVVWDIEGTDQLTRDQRGVIVASNHLSWFDPLVVAYALWVADRPPRFLAKESMFRVPLVGRIIRGAGQIAVYRETADAASAVRDALTALDRGECVVVYPEGTITRDSDLWPMGAKTGAVRMALLTGSPLYPMAHWGAQEVMAPYTKEFRIWPRKTMRVRVGDPIDLSDLAQGEVDEEVMREAGDRLMDAITGLLAEIRQEEPPKGRRVFRKGPAS